MGILNCNCLDTCNDVICNDNEIHCRIDPRKLVDFKVTNKSYRSVLLVAKSHPKAQLLMVDYSIPGIQI